MKLSSRFIPFVLFLTVSSAYACEPPSYSAATFVKPNSHSNTTIPKPPLVKLSEILRAGETDCPGMGMVVFTIPAIKQTKELAYEFKVIAGEAPVDAIPANPLMARINGQKIFYAFGWNDDAIKPIDFTVRVTAYSSTGKKGGSTTIRVRHAGR